MKETYIQTFETGLGGTSAKLLSNRFISLIDLYYGLMLPSGNDAAFLLACYYGNWLIKSEIDTGRKIKGKYAINNGLKIQLYYKKFIQFMNNYLVKDILGHKSTHFENSHGLCDKKQLSTVWEVG